MNECTSPLAEAAHDYVERGLAIIPLGVGKKEPVTKNGLNDWTDNPGQIDVWWGQGEHAGKRGNPSYNVGMACGQVSGGIIAIDLDCHSADANGADYLHDWEVEHGKLPETWTQITGSGGKQLFYRASQDIRNSANGEIGVDVRGNGGYVVLPPSLHPCGECYEWSISPDDMDVADADDKVYDFIRAVSKTKKREDGWNEERTSIPSEIKKDRNTALFTLGRSFLSRGSSHAEVATLLRSLNSTICKPPLPAGEVEKLITSVNSKESGNTERDEREAEKTAKAEKEERDGISIFDRPDNPAERVKDETVDKILTKLLNVNEVRDYIKHNSFDGRLHVLGECVPGITFTEPHVLEAGESIKLRAVMERDFGFRNKQKFEDALLAFGATDGQQYNPMHDLLESLPLVEFKDKALVGLTGAPIRISEDGGETWRDDSAVCGSLTYEFLGVEPTSYSMEVERLMFRQLVARAMHPGCKADYMVVFVGKQGTGKSTFVSLLALDKQFMLEGFSDFSVEDLKRITGKLVVEIPELDGFTGRDKNKIKSVITQTTDNYRESYAKNPVEHPRTALFFGTTNDGTFLNDNTGGRRYLLVESPLDMLKADPRLFDGTAERMIRQAWGETLALYREWGEGRFLQSLVLPANVQAESAAIQEKYTEEDSTRDATFAYIIECEDKRISRVNVKQVLMDGMGYNKYQAANAQKWQTRAITAVLDECKSRGWYRSGKQRNGKYGIARTWSHGIVTDESGSDVLP